MGVTSVETFETLASIFEFLVCLVVLVGAFFGSWALFDRITYADMTERDVLNNLPFKVRMTVEEAVEEIRKKKRFPFPKCRVDPYSVRMHLRTLVRTGQMASQLRDTTNDPVYRGGVRPEEYWKIPEYA